MAASTGGVLKEPVRLWFNTLSSPDERVSVPRTDGQSNPAGATQLPIVRWRRIGDALSRAGIPRRQAKHDRSDQRERPAPSRRSHRVPGGVRRRIAFGIGWLLLAGISILSGQVTAGLPLPPGGNVRALASDPFHAGHVWLGTTTGLVYQSRNGGRSWTFLSEIARRYDWVVARLVPDPVHSGRVYAALWSLARQDGGVYRSDDGGRTWRPVFSHHSVRALAMAPSNSSILVAGAMDGVFRSSDAGFHWQRISPARSREIIHVESVAIDPRNPGDIYVGTWHLPWKTFDGGRNWLRISRGVIDDSDVFSIAIDRSDPSRVYLSACSGIYRSDTAGMLFRKIQGIPYTARRTQDIEQDPANPRILYAGTTQGLWKSQDGGDTWMRTTSEYLNVNAVLLDPRHPGRVLLGTEHAGVLVSQDGGQHFIPANTGFSSRQVSSLVQDPEHHRIYLAVTGDGVWGGVFRSDDHGRNWIQMNAGLNGGDVHRLLWDSQGLLAGTGSGLFRYDQVRRQWIRIPTVSPGPVFDLARAGARLYAATASGLYASEDGGLEWRRLRAAPIPSYAVAVMGRRVMVAGAGVVLASRDAGSHFPSAVLTLAGRINQLACRSGLWLAATSRGLYFGSDDGEPWQLAGHGLPEEEVRSIHWQRNGIYVSTSEPGQVYRSRDDARHWTPVRISPEWDQVTRNLAGAFPQGWEDAFNQSQSGTEGFHLGRRIPTMVPKEATPGRAQSRR